AVRYANPVIARLRERHIAQDHRRLILAVLTLDQDRGAAENLLVILTIYRHRNLGRVRNPWKLNLEVEARADQDIGALDRIDGLPVAKRNSDGNCSKGGGGRKSSAHLDPHKVIGSDPTKPI